MEKHKKTLLGLLILLAFAIVPTTNVQAKTTTATISNMKKVEVKGFVREATYTGDGDNLICILSDYKTTLYYTLIDANGKKILEKDLTSIVRSALNNKNLTNKDINYCNIVGSDGIVYFYVECGNNKAKYCGFSPNDSSQISIFHTKKIL